MSRIRSVHPGLWTDEAFVSVSMPARLFAIGLWTECDDYGRFDWSPLKLKMRLMPADNVDAASLLAELIDANVVRKFDIDGRTIGAVRNFCQYQRPKLPSGTPPEQPELAKWVNLEAREKRTGGRISEDDLPSPSPALSQADGKVPPDGGCRMDKEREDLVVANATTTRARASEVRGSRIPSDWTPTKALPQGVAELAAQWPPDRLERELDGFRDYWVSRTRNATKSDWDRAWWNRIRDQHDRVMKENRNGQYRPGFDRSEPQNPMVRAAIAAELRRKSLSGEGESGGLPTVSF